MVVPAMQLASKIPDMSVQLWSSALLKGIFSLILGKHDLCFMFCYRLTLKMKTLKALQWEYLALVLLSCLQTWTRPLGTTWTPMKQPRCTRTSPSSCCRTTSLPAAYLSITSSVYVKQQVLFHVPYWIYIFPLVHCCVFILCVCFVILDSISLYVFQWTDGPPPVQIQAQNGPTTSLASLLWETSCQTCIWLLLFYHKQQIDA